ncbi:MAG: portal protein [Caldisericota bacterium]|nr:portal protein [Caldisericota bacterium]
MATSYAQPSEKGKAVVAQFEKLKAIRSPLDREYRECYEYTKPTLGAGFGEGTDDDGISNAQNTKAKQSRLLDSTATDSVRMLASSVLSSLTPPNTLWFDLADGSRLDDDLDQDSKEWLKTAAKRLHTLIHSSNYDNEAMTFVKHEIIAGIVGMYVELKNDRLRFEVWPLNHLYVQETLNLGYIDTVYRQFFYTVQEAVLEFGLNALPQKMRECYEQNQHDTKMHRFVVGIRPRIKNGKQATGSTARNLPWESIWVSGCGTVVRESGFHEMPVIVPRWQTIPDTDYARGPVFDALPDIKSLNKVTESYLLNMDMHVAGMWKVKDDGTVNPNTIKFGPRRIIPVNNMEDIQPLSAGGDINFAVNQIEALRSNIKQMLLSNKLSFEKAIQTATEVQTRNNQVRQILGPIFARMQSEFLTHLVERCFGLAVRANLFQPIPDGLAGREFEIDYRSPLARSQKMQEVEQADEFVTRIQSISQLKPEVLDLLNFDATARTYAEQLGIDPSMLNDEGTVKKIRKQRQDAQQAAAQAEQQAMQAQQQAQAPQQPGLLE